VSERSLTTKRTKKKLKLFLFSPLLTHLHPPLDRDLLHVPGPVGLTAERRVPHLDPRPRAPPEEREVGDLQGDGPVEQVGEVEVGRIVADDDVRVGLDDQVPDVCGWWWWLKEGGREMGKERARGESRFGLFKL